MHYKLPLENIEVGFFFSLLFFEMDGFKNEIEKNHPRP